MTLSKALKEFLIRSPFYGIFMLNLRKELITTEDHPIKTLAVGPNGLGVTLYVNQTFWDTLTDAQQLAVLQHEVMHICFFHLTDNFKVPGAMHKIMNIAQDCEINQYIQNLPDSAVTCEVVSKIVGQPIPQQAGSWAYYKMIVDALKDKHPDVFNQLAALSELNGDHSLWPEDMSEAEKTLIKNQIKSQLKSAAEQTVKQAGKVPGELKGILESIQDKPPVFNWKRFFRQMIGNAITNEIQLTRMRPSKRFPDARGIKMKRKPDILVGVDTSGSISDTDLVDFFSEIKHVHKTGVNVTVIEFDTKIQQVFEFTGTQNIKISGRGGTDATCVLEYYKANKKKYSSCIIFTDGYLSTFKLPLCQSLIWVITKDGYHTDYPGQVLYIS